jgi:hypothetical protein
VNIQWTSLVVAALVLVVTIELVRRRQLREKYAALWLVVSVLAVVVAVFPAALTAVSRRLGFEVPANFLFALVGIILLFVSMQLSLQVGRLEDQSQRLAEEAALARDKLAALTQTLESVSDQTEQTPEA